MATDDKQPEYKTYLLFNHYEPGHNQFGRFGNLVFEVIDVDRFYEGKGTSCSSGNKYGSGLTIECTYNAYDPNERYEHTDLYKPNSWYNVGYRNQSDVNLDKAELMVKTLRKIENGLKKLENEWGYCRDFSQYVIRIGKILGIEGILTRNLLAGSGWNNMTLDNLAQVDYILSKELRRVKKVDADKYGEVLVNK